jgi:ribokinase
MKKPKIFTIGGATFDIFVKSGQQSIMSLKTPDSFKRWLCMPHGAKIKVDDVLETFGGGATNTAVAFSRMGFDAFFIGKIGALYGEKVIENLHNENVHCRHVKKTARDKTSFSTIINTFDGDRIVLGYAGANRYFTDKDLPLDDLATADWVFLNHLSEEKSKIPAALLKILKKDKKIKMAWNPGHEQITQGVKKWAPLLERTEILFLNKEEASKFTKTPYKLAGMKKDDPRHHVCHDKEFLPPYADDVSDIMKVFFEYGVSYVVITDGRSGAQASDGKDIYFCPVQSTKRVDTLGAGDAFASGFTTAMILKKPLKTALIYGTLNAGNVVNHFGAQAGLLKKAELNKEFSAQDLQVKSSKLQ